MWVDVHPCVCRWVGMYNHWCVCVCVCVGGGGLNVHAFGYV